MIQLIVLLPDTDLQHTKRRNQTQLSKFLHLGFSEDPALQPLIFELFLSMYLVTVSGNLLTVLAILSDPHLHTLMYFFLINLSLANVCFTSTTIARMLMNIQTQSRAINYAGCDTQMFLLLLFIGLDDFLLTVMAYDKFVSICHPLHYTAIMTTQLCVQFVLVWWVLAALDSLVLSLSFGTHLEIPHFFCKLNQVIHRACSDPFLNDLITHLATVLFLVGPLAGILSSYSKIISSICAISSVQRKHKAIFICASHLSVISLYYGTGLGVHISASSAPNSASTAAASVMYTVVTPMLNPFIYSLRNTGMKKALKRLLFHK